MYGEQEISGSERAATVCLSLLTALIPVMPSEGTKAVFINLHALLHFSLIADRSHHLIVIPDRLPLVSGRLSLWE